METLGNLTLTTDSKATKQVSMKKFSLVYQELRQCRSGVSILVRTLVDLDTTATAADTAPDLLHWVGPNKQTVHYTATITAAIDPIRLP